MGIFAKGSPMMAAMRPMTWAAAVSPDFQPPMMRSAPIVEAASASRAAAWAASRAVHWSSSMSTAASAPMASPWRTAARQS